MSYPFKVVQMCLLCVQIFVTFSAVFGVAVYRICMLSVWSMNPDPEAKASVRMTVTTTGIILNMLVVLVLEEVYGAIAVWLTELGILFNSATGKRLENSSIRMQARQVKFIYIACQKKKKQELSVNQDKGKQHSIGRESVTSAMIETKYVRKKKTEDKLKRHKSYKQ